MSYIRHLPPWVAVLCLFTPVALPRAEGSTPALAQDAPTPASAGQTPEAGTAAETEAAARLLTLDDGRVLRVRARRVGDTWEVLQGKDPNGPWVPLHGSTVVRVALERDVLAEARRLEQEVVASPRASQASGRAALADWMLRRGLSTEGLSQLDRALSVDPDHPLALRVTTEFAPRLCIAALDAALAGDEPTLGTLRVAANATPAVRELAVLRLGAGGTSDELRKDLRQQLASHSPRLRAVAALALRRLFPGKALQVDDVRESINRSVLDGADEVRSEAARALRSVGDPSVTAPALRALSSTNPRLRENSIQALGVMGYRESVEPLMTYLGNVHSAVQAGRTSAAASSYLFVGTQTAYVQDFDVEVAQFSAVADPQINTLIEGSVLDARVLGSYSLSFATETRLVRNSLANLTGVDAGGTTRAWLDWWTANRSAWSAPLPEGRTSASAAIPPPRRD